jgi:hypothetical protein
MKRRQGLEPDYVEFVYRAHADGRRERYATVHAHEPGGPVRQTTGALTGPVAEFTRNAVAEYVAPRSSAAAAGSSTERRLVERRAGRRVRIDDRD